MEPRIFWTRKKGGRVLRQAVPGGAKSACRKPPRPDPILTHVYKKLLKRALLSRGQSAKASNGWPGIRELCQLAYTARPPLAPAELSERGLSLVLLALSFYSSVGLNHSLSVCPARFFPPMRKPRNQNMRLRFPGPASDRPSFARLGPANHRPAGQPGQR